MTLGLVILTAATIVFFAIKDQEKAVREKEKREKEKENENNRPKSKPRKK